MERVEFNNIDDVPNINFGVYDVDFDVKQLNSEATALLSTDKVKYTGSKNLNKFCNVGSETKSFLSDQLNNTLNFFYDWNFEYFQSGEPAGLHTDYISTPNSWKPKDLGIITHDCHLIVGVIIPLEWNCKQPYTVNYDRSVTEPRKLIFRKGEMRYIDTNEIVSYREAWNYDPEVLKYNPTGTEYCKEYADLKVHSAYEWKIGTMLVFDTKRWHSSSWFLTSPGIPDSMIEYKRSIIGFGSVDVIRKEFQ